MQRDMNMLKEMIEYYGKENIPNPEQYPLRFKFLTLSFEHHLRVKNRSKEVVKGEQK